MTSSRVGARIAACLAVLGGTGFVACGDRDAGGKPARSARAPATPATPGSASRPSPLAGGADPVPSGSATFTQIMIAYRREGGLPGARRTKEEALALARSLVERLAKGASMDELLREHTDDRDEEGQPYNGGSYTLAPTSPANPEILRAVFSTPVGGVAPDPVDSGYAWHVLRRDA